MKFDWTAIEADAGLSFSPLHRWEVERWVRVAVETEEARGQRRPEQPGEARKRGAPVKVGPDELFRVLAFIFQNAGGLVEVTVSHVDPDHVNPRAAFARFLLAIRPILPRGLRWETEFNFLRRARDVERLMRAADLRMGAGVGISSIRLRNVAAVDLAGLPPGGEIDVPAVPPHCLQSPTGHVPWSERLAQRALAPIDLYWRKRLSEGSVVLVKRRSAKVSPEPRSPRQAPE